MSEFLARLRHGTICRLLGVVEVPRRLPDGACFRAPFATCGRCGRTLRCLRVVTPPPPISAEERALIDAQAQMATTTHWLRYGA